MKNDPSTKPTEVRPSCRPYSNSVAWSSRSDIGSSRTFHSPNEKNIRAPTMNSDRRTGVPNSVLRPDLRFATMTADARLVLRDRHRVAAHQRDQHRAHDERQRVDDEGHPQIDAGEEAGAGEADRGRAERGDRQERVGGGELLVARDLGDQAVVGRVEELSDAGVEQQQGVQARRWRSRRCR